MNRNLLRRFFYVAFFLFFTALVTLFRTLPIDIFPTILVPAELVLVFCFAMALHCPKMISPFLVSCTLLLQEMVLQHPPGLWSFFGTLAYVWLEKRAAVLQKNTFLAQWGSAILALLFCYGMIKIVTVLTFMPPLDTLLFVQQAIYSILSYPLMAFLVVKVLRAQKTRLDLASYKQG